MSRGPKKKELDEAEMRRLYLDEKKPIYVCATLMEVSPGTFRRCMDDYGIETRDRGLDKEIDPDEIWAIYHGDDNGGEGKEHTLQETADALGVSVGTLTDRMDRHEIPRRSPGGHTPVVKRLKETYNNWDKEKLVAFCDELSIVSDGDVEALAARLAKLRVEPEVFDDVSDG